MKHRKSYIVLVVLLCVGLVSCAKQPKRAVPEKPKKVKEDPMAMTYVGLIRAELERYEAQPEASIETVNELIEESPGVGYFYYQRALINADAGRWKEVEEDCREALRLNPSIINAKILLARALSVLNQHAAAIKYLEEVMQKDPDREDVYPLLAKAYMNANKYKKAENVMLQLIARDSEALVAYYYLGAIYGAYMKEPRKALDVYERLLDRDPDNIQVIEAISQLYLEIGEPKKALGNLLELEKHRPNDISLKLKIAQIFYKMKEYDAAIQRFEQILQRNPESDKIMYYLGVLYEEVGRLSEATMMYRKVPPVSGLYKDARLRLAYLFKKSGDMGKAKSVLLEGINRKPKTIEFYQYLGGVYERQGDHANAIKILIRATKYFPRDESLYFALGTLYERMDDYKKAISAMRKVLKINPNNASALNYVGYTYVEKGENLEEAEEMLQKAASLKPDDGYVMDSLAWYYFKTGDKAKARILLERALKLEPKEPTILKHMGQYYLEQGDKKKALEYFKKALHNWQKKETVDQEEVDEIVTLIRKAT